MSGAVTYQFLPALSEQDYAALKADIAERGIMVPVEYDEDGHVLDGHHRLRACEELGIAEWPRIVRSFASDADKRTHARQLNLARRHLNQEQRRAVIAEELKEHPEQSNRQIASGLGVDHKTVAVVREDGEGRGEIPHVATAPDTMGRVQPIRKPRVAAIDFGDDGDAAVKAAANRAHSEKKVERKEERKRDIAILAAILSSSSSRVDLNNETCLGALNGDPDSIDWIITDPPYPQEFLPVYDDLATVAARVLKPGGSLLCMVGHFSMPAVIQKLSARLNYHWVIAYLTPGGQATQVFPRKVNTFWKPILWFVKGEYAGDWIGDVSRSAPNDNDKRFHEWGQSESGMRDLMARFVKPGDTVLDPFMGGGTTGVIALELGARFFGFEPDKDAFNEAMVRIDRAELVV